MSRETEKVFAELHKAMEGKDFQSENDINTFINQFIQNYNQNVYTASWHWPHRYWRCQVHK